MDSQRQFDQCVDGVTRLPCGTERPAEGAAEEFHSTDRRALPMAVDLVLDRGDFQIRVASTCWRSKSDVLVERMYSWRGYNSVALNNSCGANWSTTLQACSGEEVFGTLNVGFDSHAGLASDMLYRPEIDRYRSMGAVVCEFTRLAIEPARGSKELLGALFHVAYLFAAHMGHATDMFIEINPRHLAFYKRMLNFQPAGDCKICQRVDAPAILLHLDVPYMRAQATRCGGHQVTGERSLYAYFCSPAEEARVIRHIIALAARRSLPLQSKTVFSAATRRAQPQGPHVS